MNNYTDKLGAFANKIKSEAPKVPIQEIKPIEPEKKKAPTKEPEAQLNVWIPKPLLKRVKSHGIEEDLSLKEITIKALEAYLK